MNIYQIQKIEYSVKFYASITAYYAPTYKWNTRFQFSNFMPSHWILILYFVWGVVMVNYSHWPRYFKHLRFFEDIYANLSAVDDYCYFCFKFWKCILLLSQFMFVIILQHWPTHICYSLFKCVGDIEHNNTYGSQVLTHLI